MRNVQILIVSAVKICKQLLLQLLGDFVPQTPTGASPLDPLGDFRLTAPLGYSPQIKIPVANTGWLSGADAIQ